MRLSRGAYSNVSTYIHMYICKSLRIFILWHLHTKRLKYAYVTKSIFRLNWSLLVSMFHIGTALPARCVFLQCFFLCTFALMLLLLLLYFVNEGGAQYNLWLTTTPTTNKNLSRIVLQKH